MAASLSQSSVNTYRRPWILFQDFAQSYLRLDRVRFPVDSETLALFVAYLYEKSYSPTTVLTYISAIGYVHRLAGCSDPSKSDRVQLILRGYSKIRPANADTRLPITLPLLERIMAALELTQPSRFQRTLAKAMCSLAFFAALRVGEITVRPGQAQSNLLQFCHVAFMTDQTGNTKAVKLTFTNYKHSNPSRPVDLLVYREQPVCLVSRLLEYLALRGCSPGPLFCWPDNTPVNREYFVRSLQEALQFCDLDHTRYKSHSFRIGAASWAAANGMSDAQIRLFGRWKSNAFLRYIRTPTIGKLT